MWNASTPPLPGECPGCAARYDGGAESPVATSRVLLERWAVAGDPEMLVHGLFADDTSDRGLAITSDRREGFYGWWIFVAATPQAAELLESLAAG